MLVRFHGDLAENYIGEIELFCKNIREIIQIMNCNFPGFEKYFIDRSSECFEVLVNNETYLNDFESAFDLGLVETLDIYPTVSGSGENALPKILGIGLVLGSLIIPGFQIFGMSATYLGLMGGVMAIKGFFGTKKNPKKKDLDNERSNLFNGAVNASGNEMVPIILGRGMKVGSILVSMDIKTSLSSN